MSRIRPARLPGPCSKTGGFGCEQTGKELAGQPAAMEGLWTPCSSEVGPLDAAPCACSDLRASEMGHRLRSCCVRGASSRPTKFTAVNSRSTAPENEPPTRLSLPDPRRRFEVLVRATRRGRERLARKLKGQRRASPRLPASAILTAAGGAATDWSMPKLDGRMPGRERLAS